jgi:hypothetical protein
VKKKVKKINSDIRDIQSWYLKSLVAVSKKRVRTLKIIFVLAFFLGTVVAIFFAIYLRIQSQSRATERSVLMDRIIKKGCVADGLLSGYGEDTDSLIEMINRSECEYIHRAVETWAAPPNFEKVALNLQKIKKPNMIVGMFLAEAINPKEKYIDEEGNKYDFSKMCREGSQGMWGNNTCKADMNDREYRKYLVSVTKRAMDLGIASFLFGQVYMQENSNLTDSKISEVIDEMRKYAKKKNKKIVIGAQTNTISNQEYLENFDYIEGGVGESPTGHIDEGPCNDYYKEKRGGWCWAMLWHDTFLKKANDVVVHLDWSGAEDDDMSVYSRMNQEDRIRNLYKFYKNFTSKNIGFLMPFLAVINSKNSSCYGPSKEFYAPDNKYFCKDEDSINAILRGNFVGNNAKFVSQKIPEKMEAGKKYTVSITYENIGKFSWSQKNSYRLGSQSPQDNLIWGLNRIDFGKDEIIETGKTKTFTFEMAAPQEAGSYNMDWQMVADGLEWFGEKTPTSVVEIINGK